MCCRGQVWFHIFGWNKRLNPCVEANWATMTEESCLAEQTFDYSIHGKIGKAVGKTVSKA